MSIALNLNLSAYFAADLIVSIINRDDEEIKSTSNSNIKHNPEMLTFVILKDPIH